MDYDVIVLKRREDAEFLNLGLDDDNKVAFENKEGDGFYTFISTDVSGLNPSNYFTGQISTAVNDGTLPVLKRRKMFP